MAYILINVTWFLLAALIDPTGLALTLILTLIDLTGLALTLTPKP